MLFISSDSILKSIAVILHIFMFQQIEMKEIISL